eukprot:4431099-Pyramimonas_sp.AAC.1
MFLALLGAALGSESFGIGGLLSWDEQVRLGPQGPRRGLEQRSAEASWDSTHQGSGGQEDGCPSVHVRLRAAPLAKSIWGTANLGISDTSLRQLRVSAARAVGGVPRGASIGFRFLGYPSVWRRDPIA